MSKYIDAEKLYKSEIERCGCVPLVGSCSNDNKLLRDVLEEQPTADVVEVVKCRFCKHSDYIPKAERIYCMEHAAIMELNDYCSRGEISYD